MPAAHQATAHGAMLGAGVVRTITCSMDANAHGAGDVLFDTQEIAGVVRRPGGSVILQNILVLDKDDVTAAQIDLVFFSANQSLGTENSAPDITDTEAEDIIGIVSVPAANFTDLTANKIAYLNNLALVLQAAPGATSIWVAGICRGTPTPSASGMKIKFGFAN